MGWASDIFQKLETMCSEVVDEAVFEVEKVSGNVKKFYSDVMQDFLLPSSVVNPVKAVVGDLSVGPVVDTKSDDQVITDRSPQPFAVLVENTCSELCSTKSKEVETIKRPTGIKRISQKNRPIGIKRISQKNHASKISSAATSDDMNVTTSLDFVEIHDNGEAVIENAVVSGAPLEPCASDKPLSAESTRRKEDDSLEDKFPMEFVVVDKYFEPTVEIFEPVKQSELEETCILVEENKPFSMKGIDKNKKNIGEVLPSKLGSRKQDQTFSHFKDLGGNNNNGTVIPGLKMDHDEQKLPSHSSFESDWELL